MTHPAEQKVIDLLKAGQQPTAEDLGQALLAASNERHALEKIVHDMGIVFGNLVAAHLANDSDRMSEIVSQYMEKHVRIIRPEAPADKSLH